MKNSDKILVQVIFPMLSQKYDFLIGSELTVTEAKKEICREISDFEKTLYLLYYNYNMFFHKFTLSI